MIQQPNPPGSESLSSPLPPPACNCRRGGLGTTLSSALAAALTLGLIFGVLDAVVADIQHPPPRGFLGYLGCYAAAVMSYSLLLTAFLGTLGFALHPWLRSSCNKKRFRRLLIAGLLLGLFAEIYWWTRTYVFYGHSSISVERLSAIVVQLAIALGLAVLGARLLVKLPGRAHAAIRTLAVLCIVGGFCFVRAEEAQLARRGELNDRNRDLPNVLLVIVDALRADHLGCYGNQRIETPHIDALAERGVLLENCFAQAPYTLTSFGSILTGKYPRRHGLVAQRAGVRMKPNITLAAHLKSARLRESEKSLRDEDYVTGAFMTGAVSHSTGLSRGFDAYSEAMFGHDLVQVDSQWSKFRSELLLWVFKNKLLQRVDSSLVVSMARDWLQENHDRRWMAMVHLYSTHTPYDPPQLHREPYLDPDYRGPFDDFYAYHRYALEAQEYQPTPEDIERIRDLYAAGTAQADAMIGELLADLEELGVLENTLVLITSDHGEDLGELRAVGQGADSPEMRYWEHNHMWQTNLRVPMVMAHPRLLPAGRRVEDIVETIDFLPTICDLLELELPEEKGVVEIDGHSILPAIRDLPAGAAGDYAAKTFSFSENNLFMSVQDRRGKLIVPRSLLHEGDPEAIFDEGIWTRYFDLTGDPEELRNTIAEDREGASRLWAALLEWDRSMPRPVYRITDRDQEQVRWLADLGYAGGIEPSE